MEGISTSSAAVTASLLRSADQHIAVTAVLLKKALNTDQSLVNTLLPPTSSLDIRA